VNEHARATHRRLDPAGCGRRREGSFLADEACPRARSAYSCGHSAGPSPACLLSAPLQERTFAGAGLLRRSMTCQSVRLRLDRRFISV
jgi:hypothetical protein